MRSLKKRMQIFAAAALMAAQFTATAAAADTSEDSGNVNEQVQYAHTVVSDAAKTAVTYFVAANGNDDNPGTADAPFATVDKARDTIREIKSTSGLPNGGVTVYLRGGVYERSTSLEFTEEDSGTEDSRITYMSYPGERAEITGGKKINGGDFKPVTDSAVLERFYPDVRNKIVCVNLKDYGINDFGTWTSGGKEYEAWELAGETDRDAVPGLMLFADDTPLDIARVPNRIASGDNRGMWDYYEVGPGSKIRRATKEAGQTFPYTDDRVEKWKTYDDVAVYGFWSTSWKIESSQILSVNKDNDTITLKHKLGSGPEEGRRYIYLNVLEELDSDTEYYIDKNTGMLYMYARDGLAGETIGITGFGADANKDFLVYFNGASNITLSGLDITLTRTTGVYMKHCENNLIYDCDIKNIGKTAVGIGAYNYGSRGDGSRGLGAIYGTDYMNYAFEPTDRDDYVNNFKTHNNGIVNSRIKNTGSYGAFIAGGDIFEVERGDNYMYNCEVSYTGRYESALCMAIDLSGIGNTVSHCTIRDNPASAFIFNGHELIMEYNDIYRNCIDNSDYGVFYSCGWINEMNINTEIRYNYIHDVPNYYFLGDHLIPQDGVALRHAVYNDNCQPFLEVHHNVIANVPYGLYQASGHENNWNDNVFIDVLKPMKIFGNNGVASSLAAGDGPFNYLGYTGFKNPRFIENEKYKEHFPEFEYVRKHMLEMGSLAWKPSQEITGNVCVWYNYPERFSTEIYLQSIYVPGKVDGEFCTVENNTFTKKDIGFADIASGDYRFKEDAEILKTHPNLKSIDISKMGYKKNLYQELLDKNLIMKINSPKAYVFGSAEVIDDENPQTAPFVRGGSTLVPVRFVSEAFGADVLYDDAEKRVTIKTDDKDISLKIGENKLAVGSEEQETEAAAEIYGGRTFIPLRAVAEALGKEVFWDNRGLIIISEKGNTVDAEADRTAIDDVLNYSFR